MSLGEKPTVVTDVPLSVLEAMNGCQRTVTVTTEDGAEYDVDLVVEPGARDGDRFTFIEDGHVLVARLSIGPNATYQRTPQGRHAVCVPQTSHVYTHPSGKPVSFDYKSFTAVATELDDCFCRVYRNTNTPWKQGVFFLVSAKEPGATVAVTDELLLRAENAKGLETQLVDAVVATLRRLWEWSAGSPAQSAAKASRRPLALAPHHPSPSAITQHAVPSFDLQPAWFLTGLPVALGRFEVRRVANTRRRGRRCPARTVVVSPAHETHSVCFPSQRRPTAVFRFASEEGCFHIRDNTTGDALLVSVKQTPVFRALRECLSPLRL